MYLPSAAYRLKLFTKCPTIIGAMPAISSPYCNTIACKAARMDSFSASSMMRKYSRTMSGNRGLSKSVAPSWEMRRRREQAAEVCTGNAGSRRDCNSPCSTACKASPAVIIFDLLLPDLPFTDEDLPFPLPLALPEVDDDSDARY